MSQSNSQRLSNSLPISNARDPNDQAVVTVTSKMCSVSQSAYFACGSRLGLVINYHRRVAGQIESSPGSEALKTFGRCLLNEGLQETAPDNQMLLGVFRSDRSSYFINDDPDSF